LTLRCTCLLYLLPNCHTRAIECRYERIEQNTKNAMRRQKAELLVSLEVLLSDEDKNKYFPRWIFWYRPAERQDEDTSDENGVINGVQRMLAQQSKDQQGMLEQQAKDQAVQIANLTQELSELHTAAQLKQERETRIQDMSAKMEKELSELQSQMDKLQQNSEKIEKANESMQAEMSAKFDLLLAAVAQQVPAPEPEVTPSRDTA
jgi:chromosome segregation ATPase